MIWNDGKPTEKSAGRLQEKFSFRKKNMKMFPASGARSQVLFNSSLDCLNFLHLWDCHNLLKVRYRHGTSKNWATLLCGMLSHREKVSPGERLARWQALSRQGGGDFS